MTRIQLNIYVNPGQVEVFVRLKKKGNGYDRVAMVIDTGAEISLLPITYLKGLDNRLSERGHFKITQAGIARQDFSATEAVIKIRLEDVAGNITPEFEAKFWGADTTKNLLGFEDVLDKAVLHLDMPRRTGYLDINITA